MPLQGDDLRGRELLNALGIKPRELENLTPMVWVSEILDGSIGDPDEFLTSSSMRLTVEPNPLLVACLEMNGARQRGKYTWSFGLGEESNPSGLYRMLRRTTQAFSVISIGDVQTRGGNIRASVNGDAISTPRELLTFDERNSRTPVSSTTRMGVLLLNVQESQILFQFRTMQMEERNEQKIDALNMVPMHKQTRKDELILRPDEVIEFRRTLGMGTDVEGEFIVPEEVDALFTGVRQIACPAPGRPAMGLVTTTQGQAIQHRRDYPAVEVLEMTRTAAADERWSIAGTVRDVVDIAGAEPFEDPLLRKYQQECVGLHLTTDYGFVNALEPGMGKTICCAVAMREKAAIHEGPYRGLVVLESNVRQQFTAEMLKWFPDATVVTLEKAKDYEQLENVVGLDGPVVAIVSYSLLGSSVTQFNKQVEEEAEAAAEAEAAPVEPLPANVVEVELGEMGSLFDIDTMEPTVVVAEVPTVVEVPEAGTTPRRLSATEIKGRLGELLLSIYWEDMIADEAVVLKGSSATTRALWQVRQNAGTAVPMTGTPIVRSLDDLGALLAWARNDKRMFYGQRLSKNFDVGSDADLRAFTNAVGALVFRRDKSLIEDELPVATTTVVELEPNVAELRLARAAQNELRATYDELLEWMRRVEEEGADDEDLIEIRDALQAARGAMMAAGGTARQAASDPASLVNSESVAVALLESQGYVSDATAEEGTKRKWLLNEARTRCAGGQQLLVFTEYSTVAEGLANALVNQEDLRVGLISGNRSSKAREQDAESFRNGDLDILVLTRAGEKGLNLQVASAVIHYDLPWTPASVIQRTGRAERIGANVETLEVIFPIMQKTIEVTVASRVVNRAMTSMRALDVNRGVDVERTQMGRSLGGLVDTMSEQKLHEIVFEMVEDHVTTDADEESTELVAA